MPAALMESPRDMPCRSAIPPLEHFLCVSETRDKGSIVSLNTHYMPSTVLSLAVIHSFNPYSIQQVFLLILVTEEKTRAQRV